ncbi:MAG: hypothetical protein J5643_04765 [Lachnospiraceae bacterium]|nr:hypothetical protein [Lachnospiraceae bacterium]
MVCILKKGGGLLGMFRKTPHDSVCWTLGKGFFRKNVRWLFLSFLVFTVILGWAYFRSAWIPKTMRRNSLFFSVPTAFLRKPVFWHVGKSAMHGGFPGISEIPPHCFISFGGILKQKYRISTGADGTSFSSCSKAMQKDITENKKTGVFNSSRSGGLFGGTIGFCILTFSICMVYIILHRSNPAA